MGMHFALLFNRLGQPKWSQNVTQNGAEWHPKVQKWCPRRCLKIVQKNSDKKGMRALRHWGGGVPSKPLTQDIHRADRSILTLHFVPRGTVADNQPPIRE